MNRAGWALSIVLCFAAAPGAAAETCPPEGYTPQQLVQLKQAGFEIADAEQRETLAVALLACLSDPDPLLRDDIAYGGVSTWLRGQQLPSDRVVELYGDLEEQLTSSPDAGGFQQPFAALLLSEVARADRIETVLTPAMREELVQSAATYLSGVNDYRGFSDTEGWRHGVAHGSDLVLQLALNPNTNAGQIQTLVNAVSVQVAPAGEVFYIFGEPARMARAVYYAYNREIVPASFWDQWFADIADPGPLTDWADSYSSVAGLARRHNTLSFLLALHFNASLAEDDPGAQLEALALRAITRVSGG